MQTKIAVDYLYGEGQTVVKPLARVLRTVPGIFGSALLGDGRVALIVDVAGLMRMAISDSVFDNIKDQTATMSQAQA